MHRIHNTGSVPQSNSSVTHWLAPSCRVEFNTMSDPATPPDAPSAVVDGAALQQACCEVLQQFQVDKSSSYLPLIIMFPALERIVVKLATLLPDAKGKAGTRARTCMRETGSRLVQQWQEAHAGDLGQQERKEEQASSGGRRGPVAPGSFLGLVLQARDKESGTRLTDLEVGHPDHALQLIQRVTADGSLAAHAAMQLPHEADRPRGGPPALLSGSC